MAADDEKSKNQILQALDALSHTLYQARGTRRTTSLALPRSADGDADDAVVGGVDAAPAAERPRSRRLSLVSPFRSRSSKLVDRHEKEDDDDDDDDAAAMRKSRTFTAVTPEEAAAVADKERTKGGIWGWRPIRALSHMGMHRVGCLFSVEVVAAQGLPPSMNGLRLAVAVRRKDARDGALQTMPARVHSTAADFDETLYVRCHLYCSGGGGGKPLRFEPRPFLVSAVAVDAPELDLGQGAVDLSALVKESTDRCAQREGECPRWQWDMAFPLSGKAKGGELVVRIAFQVLDDGGLGIVSGQPDGGADKAAADSSSTSSSFARKLSKSSFSIMSPKVLRSKLSFSPKMGVSTPELKDIDDGFKLDEPTPPAAAGVEGKDKVQKETEREPEKVTVVEQHKEAAEPVLEAKVEQQKQPEEAKEEEQKQPEEAKDELQKQPDDVKEEQEKQLEEVNEEQLKQPEEAKDEQLKQPEEVNEEQKKQPEEVNEEEQKQPEEAKEEQKNQPEELKEEQQKEPEPEEVKSDDSELPEFDVVDKGIEGQEDKVELQEEEAEAEKALDLETTMLGAVSDEAAKSAEPAEHEAPVADANEEEVAGEPVQLPEQREDKAADAKSPRPLFGWRTVAMIVTPIAVVVSRTLATAR